MLTNYLIIPILLGISVRWSVALKDLSSSADVVDLEAMRLAKSELIRKYMNESIDPCEDFYQFACGNWRTYHPATTVDPLTMGLSMAREEYERKLVALLNETDDKYTESERKVKQFYDSCLHTSFNLFDNSLQMKKLIKEFGGMPALEGKKWQEKDFDWIKTIGEISYKYGIGIIYGHVIEYHPTDPATNILVLNSQLVMEFADTSPETMNGIKTSVEIYLQHLIGLKAKLVKQTAKEIVDFAVRLWKADQIGGALHQTTVEEMHRKYSRHLNIMKLVKASFGFVPDGVVIDANSNYVEALATIMKKTPKRIVANYIFYALIVNYQVNLISDKTNNDRRCLGFTKIHFLPILYHLSYRTSNLSETEQEFHRMWHGITTTLQNTFESNLMSWFDDDSREAALEKLYLMKLYIGSFEDVNFDEQYKELTLNRSDFTENINSMLSFTAKQMRQSLNDKHYFKHYEISPFTPSYVTTGNVVRFPMTSLLTDFLWSKYVPHAVNYGRLGTVVGHEIIHGFSGDGRTYNRFGMFMNWIYKDIGDEYDERRRCYYEQYHNFTLDNKPLPQDEVQEENLADNGGILLAYHTYLRWLADEARTQQELDMETLPHLNYSNKQLFFIGYSQTWCADTLPSVRFEAASIDAHTPPEFRGFIPLINFGEFSKEFNCPSGSPMNPRKKCTIY